MALGSNLTKTFLRPTNIPAAIAALVALVCGALADHQNSQLSDERSRAEVMDQVSLIRAKLEGDINGDIQLVRGLVGRHFHRAEHHANALRRASREPAAAAARRSGASPPPPTSSSSLEYPLKGNEAAIGLDYRKNEQQREAALRARDSGDVVLAGPLDLVQGGKGLIARFPVFTNRPDGDKTFWGVVSAVIDIDKLYRDSGLVGRDLPIDVAITGTDARGKEGARFFGDAAGGETTVRSSPTCSVPSGSWRIAATPKGGWDAAPSNRWMLRLGILAAGLMIVIPAWLVGRLVEERRDHFSSLRDREGELERLSRRLELALDASKVGVWDFNIDTRRARLGRPHERALQLPARRRRSANTGIGATGSTRRDARAGDRGFRDGDTDAGPLRIAIQARPGRRANAGHPRDRQGLRFARSCPRRSSASIGTQPPTSR